MPASQLRLDGVLAAQQPVHRLVHLVAGRIRDAQVRAEGDVVPPGQGRQLRLRRDHPGDDQRIGQVPLTAGRTQDAREPQLLRGGVHQGDMAVRAGPGNCQRRAGVDQRRAFEHRLDRVHRRGRQRRQVRQGFLADLPVRLAERPAQQPRLILPGLPGLRRMPAPHPVYMHPAGRLPPHKAIIPPLAGRYPGNRRLSCLQFLDRPGHLPRSRAGSAPKPAKLRPRLPAGAVPARPLPVLPALTQPVPAPLLGRRGRRRADRARPAPARPTAGPRAAGPRAADPRAAGARLPPRRLPAASAGCACGRSGDVFPMPSEPPLCAPWPGARFRGMTCPLPRRPNHLLDARGRLSEDLAPSAPR